MTAEQWRARDIVHLWHPYTDMTALAETPFPVIERAEGVWLQQIDGAPLLDGISSWWCVNLGHGHLKLIKAIQEQAVIMQHCMLGGMTHPNAILLAERLAALAPPGLAHVHFASDGTCAVEAALKMALQYWVNLGEPAHNRFICLEDGYHGDSLGAVGVGYVDEFHRPFAPVLAPAWRAPSPHCARCPQRLHPESCDVACFAPMEALIREHRNEAAAVIVEPLCQGAAGMRIYPAEYLKRLDAVCRETGVLFIADEIAVGFGRTGAMFACGQAGVAPDIMTIGKGLTGGYLPMSATLANDRVYGAFLHGPSGASRTFFHGHTFCGNPITAALALTALDIYDEERIIIRMPPRAAQLREGFARLAKSLKCPLPLSLGMIASIEIADEQGGAARAKAICAWSRENGLFIRPLGPVIYLWPPLVSTEDELDQMLGVMEKAVHATRT